MCNISELYIQRGYEKGFKIGVRKAKIEYAIRMFNHDVPIDIIADVVEMSIEETQKLIEENKSSISTNSPNL